LSDLMYVVMINFQAFFSYRCINRCAERGSKVSIMRLNEILWMLLIITISFSVYANENDARLSLKNGGRIA